MTWIFNTAAMTATHGSGLRIQFEIAGDGMEKLSGTVIGVVPYSLAQAGPEEFMRLIGEAGTGMAHALHIKDPLGTP